MPRSTATTARFAALALLALAAIIGTTGVTAQDDTDAAAATTVDELTVIGPLVGHVTSNSVTIWMYAAGPTAPMVDLIVSHQGQTVAGMRKPGSTSPYKAVRFTVSGLRPGTRFHYTIKVDDKTDPRWTGGFMTPVPDGTPCRFSMATSSCMHKDDPQSSWYLLMTQNPAFHMLLGDAHYADTTDHDIIWDHHLEYRTVPEFAAVCRHIPTYAIWDDHDYGPNNSDGTAPGKEDSLRAFASIYANPPVGIPGVPGAFYSFTWGDVEFFVLDGRYHRSPNSAPDDEHKRMLGDEQFEWLAEGLRTSSARFKVLATGSTFEASKSDGWSLFSFSRQRLFDFINDNRIDGVVALTGDMHWCDVQTHGPDVTGGYPIHEIISSGITRGKDRGFATLRFDTVADDPTIRVRIIYGDATIRHDQVIRLSEISHK